MMQFDLRPDGKELGPYGAFTTCSKPDASLIDARLISVSSSSCSEEADRHRKAERISL
jgi:hypothetical protein